MSYVIDYTGGEKVGCSSKIIIADRIFYVKLFSTAESRFFSGDQEGVIQKEISFTEFDLWINVLADNEGQVLEIKEKLESGKRY
jgi:hypothetical protein